MAMFYGKTATNQSPLAHMECPLCFLNEMHHILVQGLYGREFKQILHGLNLL